MIQVSEEDLQTISLDHHGLFAAVCHDLSIAEKNNSRIKKNDKRRVLSIGKAVVAMILNGLGFTNRPSVYVASVFGQH
jgi:hypothetical protein